MKIVIPGGSGYLGRILESHLVAKGHEVVVLSREPKSPNQIAWDGEALGPWVASFEGAGAVINLAGRSVNCRYDEDNRREIFASRLLSTAAVGQAIQKTGVPVWLNASSATIYRHAEDRAMDEEDGEIGHGFSVDVCQRWEEALAAVEVPSTRKVAMRTAMVFGPGEGGVFDAFQAIVRRGIGGTMGDGKQVVSWIHHRDCARAVEWLLECGLEGAVNVCAPNPLPNREFMAEIRKAMHPRLALRTTRWMLEVGAQAMGTETELLLKSRWVVPKRLLQAGFQFEQPHWGPAVHDILASH